MGAVIMLYLHHLEIIIIIYYPYIALNLGMSLTQCIIYKLYMLYGNGLILYSIDRLWKAGKNQGIKSGV